MAAKKKGRKPSPGSAAKKAEQIKTAARITGLSASQIAKIDEERKGQGKKPLSFLAEMLDKSRKHVPKLETEVTKAINSRHSRAPSSKKGK